MVYDESTPEKAGTEHPFISTDMSAIASSVELELRDGAKKHERITEVTFSCRIRFFAKDTLTADGPNFY